MRILAIRGKNLASLAEPFEILFNQGVLQTAGLFAITGQTGAGKSTILDALCLALYDKIPRLPDGQGVSIGHAHEEDHQRVKSNDVRSILRRGTQHAYAEVDFIGKDKQPYRARWELRKTRTSTLQKQEMLLTNLNNQQRVGQGKTQTLAAISERIDLSFEQFRRSVLLAQGDFAAFLKAKKDERSSLLERITGTELYSELSKAAFERAKNEKETLQALDNQAKHLIPLGDTERNDLTQQLSVLTAQMDALSQQLNATQQLIDWHSELNKRQQAERLANDVLAQWQQRYQATAAERTLIAQVEAAQPVRVLLSHYQTADSDYKTAEEQLNRCSTASNASALKWDHAKTALAVQEQVLQQAEQQQSQAVLLLKKVRELDMQDALWQQSLTALAQERQDLQQQLQSARQAFEQLNQNNIEQEQRLAQLNAELAYYSDYQAMAAEWTHWHSELARYQHISISQNAAQLQQQHSEQLSAETQAQQHRLMIAIQHSDSVQQQQQQKLLSLQQQATGISLSEVHQQKEVLERQCEYSRLAIALVQQSLSVQAQQQQHQQQLAQAQQTQQRASEQLNHLTEQQLRNHAALTEAKQALALLHASRHQDALQFRALLMAQQPCPVCGALEHPWYNRVLAQNDYSDAQQQRVELLEQQQQQLIKQHAETEQNCRHAYEQVMELTKAIDAGQANTQQLAEAWHALVLDNKGDFTALNADKLQALIHTGEQLQQVYTQLKQQEKAAVAQQDLVATQQQAVIAAQEHNAQLQQNYARLDKQQAEQLADSVRYRDSVAQYQQQRHNIEQNLSVPLQKLAHWRDYLHDYRALQTIVTILQQAEQQVLSLSQTLADNQQQVLLLTQQRELKQQQLSKIDSEQQQLTAQQQALMQQRHTLLPITLSADAYENNIHQQVSAARTAQQQQLAQLNQIDNELASQKSQQQHWQQESQRRYHVLNQAHAALTLALSQQQIDFTQLNTLLAYDSLWLTTEKTRLADLDLALQEATALVSIKAEDRRQHQSHAPSLNEVEALQQYAALQQQQQQLTSAKQDGLIQLREDDKKRQASAVLQGKLVKQQQCWQQWEALNKLIGSSTGTKFRVFAQSLTLEALLTHSNAHLSDFAPRYHLQRVPNSELELQIIDRDMANEVRSVHSLSGGESFLVSLALALGLASLASNKTQVESLFIDEGFGSLDPETLDIAIASLDTLQSLGRKIGIISHVPILVERIGAKIMVEKQGGGRSKVIITNGWSFN